MRRIHFVGLTGAIVLAGGCKPISTSSGTPLIHRKSLGVANSVPVVHVLVALCDNKYQGIVPVPARIGDGDKPEENLYWGCDLGVKTYFRHSKDWKLEQSFKNPASGILERLIFSHRGKPCVLVADAYRGREIKRTTEDFLEFASGDLPSTISINRQTLSIGGGANFVVYVGHDGLMNFQVSPAIAHPSLQPKNVAILCCKSQQFFGPALKATNVRPILLTRSLMAPEAYVVEAAIQSFMTKESGKASEDRAARTYAKYQKISFRSAKTVFASEF